MYADIMNVHTAFLGKYIWKIKVPLKINVVSLLKKVILTKDNLSK
jgi:hypothetical protein